MNLEETIRFFSHDHQRLEDTISQLSNEQMIEEIVQGSWTVKDIISHISAWNWELISQTELVLSGKKPWYTDKTESEFNDDAIRARKSWFLEKVLQEWRESFEALINKMEKLSPEEWTFELSEEWPEGGKITVASIFRYRYRGYGHEGGHSKVIRDYFGI